MNHSFQGSPSTASPFHSLAPFLLRARFPVSVAVAGRPLLVARCSKTLCGQSTPPLEASSGLSHLKLVSSSHLPIFKDGGSLSASIHRMMWCCRVPINRSRKSWKPWEKRQGPATAQHILTTPTLTNALAVLRASPQGLPQTQRSETVH